MEETRFTKEDAQKLLAENPRCVVIPEGGTSFISYPFADNTEIEEIHLPKSIMGIGTAFQNNEKLTKVEYAGTVAEWEKVTGIYELLETSAKIVKCSDGEWEVPTLDIRSSYKGGKYLKKCAKFAESVVIPSDVEEICGNAFSNCKHIKSLKIPSSVKAIRSSNYDGHFAFDRMESLEEIEIPATVESFEAKFCGCTSLKTVRLKFTQKEIWGSTFQETVTVGRKQDENGRWRDIREKLTCPALETVELPIVETINKCLKDLPALKTVIFPDELGSLNPLDIISIPESAEIVLGENAKIAKTYIEKDGKTTAEIIYVKKTGRLLAVRTKETSLVLPDCIKQIEPNCFPPCVIELEMPKTLKKIKLPKKDRWDDYEIDITCSKNLLAFLENYDLSSSDAVKEKLKKEKIATIEATGTGGLALAELDGLEVETKPVTKPRVGSTVTVKLPYEHKIEFFYPKKQKSDEQEALTSLFTALKAEHDDTTESKLDYLEKIFNVGQQNKEILKAELTKADFDDATIQVLLTKKLEGTEVKSAVENHIVKLVAQDRFAVVCKAEYPKYAYSPFRIDSDFEMLKNSAEKIAVAKSKEEVRDEVEWLLPCVIDMNGWHTPCVL
ncbi:MAG: leucine-rich repeat domain-containing protein [Treponema sp.]|nr:leucine-rich repeat domain-containing protein [Treponema sp.]